MTDTRRLTVKPLEWLPTTINGQHLRDTAQDMDGRVRYEVGVVPGHHYCLIQLPKGGGLKSIPCASVEEAKAVAQADHDRRILSALTPAPVAGWRSVDVPIPADVDKVDIWILGVGRVTNVVHPGAYAGATHWMPLPPAPGQPITEQPSVKEAAVDALDSYQQADEDGIMVLVSRQAIEECLPALRSLAGDE